MKDVYETPVMEIVTIDEKDIIFASCVTAEEYTMG